jgi:hypothetical protein
MTFQYQKIKGLTQHEWRDQVLLKNVTIADQLACWLALACTETLDHTSEWRNCELEEAGIRVLVRKKLERINETNMECLVIAAVEVPVPMQQNGWFKSFLSLCCEINPWDAVVIEDVENEHLQAFCERLGFIVFNPFFKTTYLVDKWRVAELRIPVLGRTVPVCGEENLLAW